MIIEARFNGPPDSGNGGYSAGAFALACHASSPDALGPGPIEVTLRKPPPLDTPLSVRALEVYDGDVLIASAAPATVDESVPGVSFVDATAVSPAYPGFTEHPFPTCYGCGPERPDGLRLFAGRLPDGRMAAPWRVPSDVTVATVWAALDCTGGWSIDMQARPYVLGRIAARVDAVPEPGSECVVMGELTGLDGRKCFTRTSVYSPSGELLATARSTWLAL